MKSDQVIISCNFCYKVLSNTNFTNHMPCKFEQINNHDSKNNFLKDENNRLREEITALKEKIKSLECDLK
jgi:hypothetical protein